MDRNLSEPEILRRSAGGDIQHDGHVRVGPFMAIPDILQKQGHDPSVVAASAGFELRLLDDPDNMISYLTADRLLSRCAAVTRCEHFGLLIGKTVSPSHLGLAGYLTRTAKDVSSALETLVEHLDLHDRGGVPTLHRLPDESSLGYTIYQQGTEATAQIYDLAIAAAYNILRAVCGEGWSAKRILLSRPRPSNEAPYKHFFHAPVHFETKESAVVFPSHWLDQPVPSSDPLLFRYLSDQAREMHAQLHVDLVSELEPLLYQCLKNQECHVTTVARYLGIHERTLNRRLHAEGTTFRQELERARQTLSQRLLSTTTVPMVEVASSVGYSDVSTFSRAFKRWVGVSPGKWRASNRGRQ